MASPQQTSVESFSDSQRQAILSQTLEEAVKIEDRNFDFPTSEHPPWTPAHYAQSEACEAYILVRGCAKAFGVNKDSKDFVEGERIFQEVRVSTLHYLRAHEMLARATYHSLMSISRSVQNPVQVLSGIGALYEQTQPELGSPRVSRATVERTQKVTELNITLAQSIGFRLGEQYHGLLERAIRKISTAMVRHIEGADYFGIR